MIVDLTNDEDEEEEISMIHERGRLPPLHYPRHPPPMHHGQWHPAADIQTTSGAARIQQPAPQPPRWVGPQAVNANILAAALQRASGSTFSGRHHHRVGGMHPSSPAQQCRQAGYNYAASRQAERAAFMAHARQQLYGTLPQRPQPFHFSPLTLSVASPSTFKATTADGPMAPGVAEVAKTMPGAVLHDDGVWELPLSQHVSFCVAMQQRRIVCERIPQRVLNQLAAANASSDEAEGNAGSNSKMDDDGYAREEDGDISDIPRSVWSSLAPFQRAGVSWIVRNNGRALLADEPGLGKTIQAIGAACAYRHEWPLLVVSPSSARFHWEAEFRQWLPDRSYLPSDAILVVTSEKSASRKYVDKALVIVTSYDLVHREVVKKALHRVAPNVVICDECHYLKNGKAQRTKALLPLLKSARRAILLSGTPALSRPSEVFWQLHALDPNQWADATDFHKRYCSNPKSSSSSSTSSKVAKENNVAASSSSSKEDKYSGACHLEELHILLRASLMLRRNKASILTQLPMKRRIRRRITIDDAELRAELRAELEEFRERASELAELSKKSKRRRRKRRRSASFEDDDEDYEAEEEEDRVVAETSNGVDPASQQDVRKEMARKKKALLLELFRRSGMAKLPGVERHVRDLLSRKNTGKLLIFAHHRAALDALANGCLRDVPHIRIDGSTPGKERQSRVNKFQNDATVIVALLGITAAGVALTLTAASRVLFAELYWTPAALLQAEDRAHRIGQTSEVVIEYLLADDCVDDVLWPCIQHKMLLLGELFENHKQYTMHATDQDDDDVIFDEEDAKTSARSPSRRERGALEKDYEDTDLIELEELEELHHEDPEALDFEAIEDAQEDNPARGGDYGAAAVVERSQSQTSSPQHSSLQGDSEALENAEGVALPVVESSTTTPSKDVHSITATNDDDDDDDNSDDEDIDINVDEDEEDDDDDIDLDEDDDE